MLPRVGLDWEEAAIEIPPDASPFVMEDPFGDMNF